MFLDNVVTQVIVAEGDGMWREYVGGYTDWERVATNAAAEKKVAPKPVNVVQAVVPSSPATPADKLKKLSYKEQRELETLPEQIALLEDEQRALSIALAAPDIYRQNPAEAKRMSARIEEIEVLLLEALEKWERIEARSRL